MRTSKILFPTVLLFVSISLPVTLSAQSRPDGDHDDDETSQSTGDRGTHLPKSTFGPVDFPGAAVGTEVFGINSKGVVVGDYFDSDVKHTHGFVAVNGDFKSIDFPEATGTTAIAINNSGEIVGSYTAAGGDQHGFLLNRKGFTTIDYPGATLTVASVINETGDIGGSYFDSNGKEHGFVLSMGRFHGFTGLAITYSASPTVASLPSPIPIPPPSPASGSTPVAAPAPKSTPIPTLTAVPPPVAVTSPTPIPTPTSTPIQDTTTVSSTGIPTPPSTAQKFPNLEREAGWQDCNASTCAGGSGIGAYWFAQHQTTPSLSGDSMVVYNSGIGANSLWWNKLGANSSATNFLWDFYAQVDSVSLTAAQALEFDSFQFVGGYNFMFGSQCNLAAGKWDVWDELNGQWVHTSIPCTTFEPGVWHHIQWYVQRFAGTHNYNFVTLVVDGKSYQVNRTYSAKYVGWGDDIGVQYQLDVNGTGLGYHEWVDNSSLTVW